jgi:hypothetical protein
MQPEDLEQHGYVLMDELNHQELIPFAQANLKTNTTWTKVYVGFNVLFLAWGGYLVGAGLAEERAAEVIGQLSFGLAVALLLIPLHEWIHVLAYRSAGARETSYAAQWKKFYFMALAHRFVANEKAFQRVALAPFVVITAGFTLAALILPAPWNALPVGTLILHTAFCSGDFALLSYFEKHRNRQVVTYDDVPTGMSYFYGKPTATTPSSPKDPHSAAS